MLIHPDINWTNLTPEPGHFLFGYYDRCPWNADSTLHLALKVPQQERLPAPGEKATVGYVDRRERKFTRVADTYAWCHQQGAMTLWLKHEPDTFIYNDFIEKAGNWKPICRKHTVGKGATGRYEFPVYTLSADGRWGGTLNFNRIPRRGYTYALAPAPEEHPEPDIDNDGLFVVNMHTGKKNLVASYRDFINAHPFPYDIKGQYLWLNHIIFNRDSSRLMVLLRQCKNTNHEWPWKTHLFSVGVDGSGLTCSLPDIFWAGGKISHQIWGRTPAEIVVDANWCGRGHEYVAIQELPTPFQAQRISEGMGPQGHLSFSPDYKWIAADTYPDKENSMQTLALVNVSTGKLTEIGRFAHKEQTAIEDVRCDLHPRWSHDGRFLTVDTIHNGDRKIYQCDVDEIKSEIFSSYPAR